MTLPALTITPTTTGTTKPPQPPPQKLTPHRTENLKIIKNPKPQFSLRNKNPKGKPIGPIVLWTSSISKHCHNGNLSQAIIVFNKMRLSGIEPNYVTFITLISFCANNPLEGKAFGPLVHAYVTKLGLVKDHVMVGTALVDMYSKLGEILNAGYCFDGVTVKNLFTWNTMIGGYVRNGDIDVAMELFDEMPDRDVITWTVLIDGFVKLGRFEQAVDLFREMQVAGVESDYVTVIAVLAACANMGMLGLGLWVHRYILAFEIGGNTRVCNSLIDMYSRCGCIELARQVFDKMVERTLVSWNSIIVGFATNGFAEEALEYFELMEKEGFTPDEVTYTGALTACSHCGLVDAGLRYFETMELVHKLSPRIEHYGCIVDIYSRAGQLEEAFNVVKNMKMKPNEVVLGSLLSACRNYGDVSVAERVMEYLIDIDPSVDSNYILLANMYASGGQWEGANNLRRTMKALGVEKNPGYSSVEIGSTIHEFVASDKSHDETKGIYLMLELLSFELRLCGYVQETTVRS